MGDEPEKIRISPAAAKKLAALGSAELTDEQRRAVAKKVADALRAKNEEDK